MATNRETGKNVNASNFIEKVNVLSRHNGEYKPSNPLIQISALTPIQQKIKNALDEEKRIQPLLTAAISNRAAIYDRMEKTAASAINLLAGTNAKPAQIEAGKKLFKKFKSIRISDLPNEEDIKAKAAAKGEEAVIPKTRSNSQQGYVNKLANYNTMVSFLGSEKEYQPNEEELTVETMRQIATEADQANLERNRLSGEMAKAVEVRVKLMNDEPNGAFHLSKKIHSYVLGSSNRKSAFYRELLKYPVRKR